MIFIGPLKQQLPCHHVTVASFCCWYRRTQNSIQRGTQTRVSFSGVNTVSNNFPSSTQFAHRCT